MFYKMASTPEMSVSWRTSAGELLLIKETEEVDDKCNT